MKMRMHSPRLLTTTAVLAGVLLITVPTASAESSPAADEGVAAESRAEAISALSLSAGVSADDITSAAEAGDLAWSTAPATHVGRVSAASDALPPWRACGLTDPATQQAKVYPRAAATTPTGIDFPAGDGNLNCGSNSYGVRHIDNNHRSQWDQARALTGEVSWTEPADDFIAAGLSDPGQVTYRSNNDTFCFQRLMYLVNKDTAETVATRNGATVVGQRTKNIITAFPGTCPSQDT